MRAVIQRVSHASVTIEGIKKSEITQGFLILLGICNEDTTEDVDWLVKKIANLRVFGDENDVMNRSILDVGGNSMLAAIAWWSVSSHFTPVTRKAIARVGSGLVLMSTLSHSTRLSAKISPKPLARPLVQVNLVLT